MLKKYTDYLFYKTIGSVYVTPRTGYKFVESLITSYVKLRITEDEVLNKFIEYLGSLKKKELDKTTDYKADYIVNSIDITPSSVLDIGAGTGTILSSVKKYYNLETTSVYALDLQPILREDITVIGYTDDMKIPLGDGKIDLVIMLSLLHHVEQRDELLSEVYRVLSPNGRVIIREHDGSNDNKMYYIFLQLLHYVWYVYNNESRDPLLLMTREQTLELFSNHGFISHSYLKSMGKSNIQEIYGEVYKKNNS